MIVILSTPMMLVDGTYSMRTISLKDAFVLIDKYGYKNYSGHQTVKILNIEPATTRESCEIYDKAIVLQPNKRLEFGKEYSLEEIEEIGVAIKYIERLTGDSD